MFGNLSKTEMTILSICLSIVIFFWFSKNKIERHKQAITIPVSLTDSKQTVCFNTVISTSQQELKKVTELKKNGIYISQKDIVQAQFNSAKFLQTFFQKNNIQAQIEDIQPKKISNPYSNYQIKKVAIHFDSTWLPTSLQANHAVYYSIVPNDSVYIFVHKKNERNVPYVKATSANAFDYKQFEYNLRFIASDSSILLPNFIYSQPYQLQLAYETLVEYKQKVEIECGNCNDFLLPEKYVSVKLMIKESDFKKGVQYDVKAIIDASQRTSSFTVPIQLVYDITKIYRAETPSPFVEIIPWKN